jgi:hypothetical protein
VRVIILLALAALLQEEALALAQKKQDPELRNKQAVSIKSPKSHSAATSPVRSSASSASARDLTKIERNGIQKTKATRKASSSWPGSASGSPASPVQPKSKPVKFSHHPPQAAGKTATKSVRTTPSTASPR